MSHQLQYEQVVQATHTLARACGELVTIRSGGAISHLLDDAIAVTANALTYLSGQRSNEATKKRRAHVHLELALLYRARSGLTGQQPTLAIQTDIEETANHVRSALDYFTKENAPAEYQQATRLQRNTEARAGALATTAASATPLDLEPAHSNDAITSAD